MINVSLTKQSIGHTTELNGTENYPKVDYCDSSWRKKSPKVIKPVNVNFGFLKRLS